MRDRLVRAASTAIGLAALAAFGIFFTRVAGSLPRAVLTLQNLGALTLATILALGVSCLGASGWALLVRSVGNRKLSLTHGASISLRSQIAKYLPGNVGHYLGRLVLGSSEGVGRRAIVAASGAEVGLTILVVGSVAALGPAGALGGRPAWMAALVLGIIVAAGLVLARSERMGLRLPSLTSILTFGALVGLGCVLHGVALWILATALRTATPPSTWWLMGAFAAAWLPGFLLPGLPGGLGVREAALTALLAVRLPLEVAVVVVLFSRLASALGDGLAFLLGRWLLRRQLK